MRPIIRQIELARMVGISQPTINRSVKDGALRAALAPDGVRLWADHPATLEFIEKRIGRAEIGRDGSPTPPALQSHRTPAPDADADPFATAANLANVGGAEVGTMGPPAGVEASPGGSTDARVKMALYDVQQSSPRHLPESIDDLGALTMREVMERFGSLPALKDAVQSMRNFADMQVKAQTAQSRRRELVERTSVSHVLVPLIDLAFKRLVGEAPVALRQQIIARVLAGGDDLAMDVEELIRREVGGILEDCKAAVSMELEKLEEGAS